jgi:hypothetical protein
MTGHQTQEHRPIKAWYQHTVANSSHHSAQNTGLCQFRQIAVAT